MPGGRFRMLGKKDEEDGDLPDPAKLPPPLATTKSSDATRIKKFLEGVSTKLNPEAGNALKAAAPAVAIVVRGFVFVWPYYKKAFLFCYRIYKQLPLSGIQMIVGIALCFFGGTYVGARPRLAHGTTTKSLRLPLVSATPSLLRSAATAVLGVCVMACVMPCVVPCAMACRRGTPLTILRARPFLTLCRACHAYACRGVCDAQRRSPPSRPSANLAGSVCRRSWPSWRHSCALW